MRQEELKRRDAGKNERAGEFKRGIIMAAAMVGAAHGDGKRERNLDSGATFHMSHTRAVMTIYKKASAGTTVEIADGTILPVDGFGTIEVDLDQPGNTTKPVKMAAVAFVLSPRKAVEQGDKPLIYHKVKLVLGFPGKESLVFIFCPRKELFSGNMCETDPESRGGAGVGSKNG